MRPSERHWEECTEEKYFEMLEVLPPVLMSAGAFLVGEPSNHEPITGVPRFACFKREDGKHFALSEPMTVAEFRRVFP